MIALTGIPCTGKTTLCEDLAKEGFECVSADVAFSDCISSGEADSDCMRSRDVPMDSIVESHYSHLLDCRAAIILENDEDTLKERMMARGYPDAKIAENLEVQRSETIRFEALETVPSGRIFTVNASGLSREQTFGIVSELIRKVANQLRSQ